MKKNELFERIKKRGIESVKYDIDNNKARIYSLRHLNKRNENELKEIPKSIEQRKKEIELLKGQIQLMRKTIAEIEEFKLLEEE